MLEESDYDSSSSSISTTHGFTSDFSFGSSSSSSSTHSSPPTHKPHKANQPHWEAVAALLKRLRKPAELGLHHFQLLERIGSGDIGNVYLCHLRGPAAVGCLYAMKVVDREVLSVKKKLERAEMEREILGLLDHPFLPTLYAQFDASRYSCLVMEFCSGGDLYYVRQRQPQRRFPLSSARFYAAETLLALEYLHMMGVVYRDLKPENVLVREDGHIMLSDFDLSFKCDVVPKLARAPHAERKSKATRSANFRTYWPSSTNCFSIKRDAKTRKRSNNTFFEAHELVAEPVNARSRSFVGTHEYLAPEVIAGTGHGGAVDWWTFGVFLFELLYGRTPFKGENNDKTLINIIKEPLNFPKIGGFKSSRKELEEMEKAQDLIKKLLVKNPKKRIGSLMGSVEIKRHDFFRDVNWALIRSVRPPEIPRDSEKIRKRSALLKMKEKEIKDGRNPISQHFDYF